MSDPSTEHEPQKTAAEPATSGRLAAATSTDADEEKQKTQQTRPQENSAPASKQPRHSSTKEHGTTDNDSCMSTS